MKTIFVAIIICTISITTISSQTYTLNKSALSWTGKAAFNSYELTGTLETFEGYLSINNNIITELEIVVDMKSLDHENSDLKSHLRSDDFFDVNKFKKATFKLEKPVTLKDGQAIVMGLLTIKQTSKNVSILIQLNTAELKMSFNTALNRVDYGITYNSPTVFEKLKENAIADEFILKGDLYFKK